MSQKSKKLVVRNHVGTRVNDGEILGESNIVVEQVSVAEEIQSGEGKCLQIKWGGSGGYIAEKKKRKSIYENIVKRVFMLEINEEGMGCELDLRNIHRKFLRLLMNTIQKS